MAKKSNRPRDMANDIIGLVRAGTKRWTRTVKAEERSPASRFYRISRMTRERGVSLKEAASQIMRSAYMQASGGGALPANARQIMYAARGHIQKVTGKQLEPNYFTQTLLPDYVQETGVDWDVVFDARGHFDEPHGGDSFGIGTLEVRDYLARFHDPSLVDAGLSQAKIETCGPDGNFGAVLFIEKEGFAPLLEAAGIADKYDIAIMSTKGMSVTAARALADEMCHEHDIPLLLLRDFDKAGFSIAGTLQRDTRRYEFQNSITIIDLGLSLEDAEAMGLESEHQHHPKGSKTALMDNLRKNGASDQEIAFMFQDFDKLRCTRRVELNAMTSPQFIAFIERKLQEHGVRKVVPSRDALNEAFDLFACSREIEKIVKREMNKLNGDASVKPPSNLSAQVRQYLEEHPKARWDAAVSKIAATAAKASARRGTKPRKRGSARSSRRRS